MSDLLILISEYGWYLFIGVAGLVSVAVFAIHNAEDCPMPAECFDCNEITCQKCHHSKQKVRTGQWVCKPDFEHAPMLTGGDAAGQENALLPSK